MVTDSRKLERKGENGRREGERAREDGEEELDGETHTLLYQVREKCYERKLFIQFGGMYFTLYHS